MEEPKPPSPCPRKGCTEQGTGSMSEQPPETTHCLKCLEHTYPQPPDHHPWRCPDKKSEDHTPTFPVFTGLAGEHTATRTQRKSKLLKPHLGTLLMATPNKERQTGKRNGTPETEVSCSEIPQRGEGSPSAHTEGEPSPPGTPSHCSASHRVHKQLLAGLANALQGHVYILLSWETIHAVIQGVRDSFGHLQREKSCMREPFPCKHCCRRVGSQQGQCTELKSIGKLSASIQLTLFTTKSPHCSLSQQLTSCLGKGADTVTQDTLCAPGTRLSHHSVTRIQKSPMLCQVLRQRGPPPRETERAPFLRAPQG